MCQLWVPGHHISEQTTEHAWAWTYCFDHCSQHWLRESVKGRNMTHANLLAVDYSSYDATMVAWAIFSSLTLKPSDKVCSQTAQNCAFCIMSCTSAIGQIRPTTILRVANPDCLELVKSKSNLFHAMLKPELNIAVQLLVCCNTENVFQMWFHI